jgi:hypothetical protein
VPDPVDEEIDRLLRRPLAHVEHVELEREDDAGAAVHAPEERADALFGRLVEAEVVEQQFPVERPALAEERAATGQVGAVAVEPARP